MKGAPPPLPPSWTVVAIDCCCHSPAWQPLRQWLGWKRRQEVPLETEVGDKRRQRYHCLASLHPLLPRDGLAESSVLTAQQGLLSLPEVLLHLWRNIIFPLWITALQTRVLVHCFVSSTFHLHSPGLAPEEKDSQEACLSDRSIAARSNRYILAQRELYYLVPWNHLQTFFFPSPKSSLILPRTWA